MNGEGKHEEGGVVTGGRLKDMGSEMRPLNVHLTTLSFTLYSELTLCTPEDTRTKNRMHPPTPLYGKDRRTEKVPAEKSSKWP